MIEELKRFVGPLERRIRSMLMRATVTGVDDSHDIQQIQVERLQGETIDECDRVGEYGFTSVPPWCGSRHLRQSRDEDHSPRRWDGADRRLGRRANPSRNPDHRQSRSGRECLDLRHTQRPRAVRRPLPDIALRVSANPLTRMPEFDIELTDIPLGAETVARDAALDNGLDTAIYVSLFTDARADPETARDPTDLRGWWGDEFGPIGSRLWELTRGKATDEALSFAKTAAEDALRWLIDEGIATAVTATGGISATAPILPASVLSVLARVFAGAAHLHWGFLEWIARQVFPDTAEAEYLERWAAVYGIYRTPATYASAEVQVSGTNGTVLPAGTIFVASGWRRVRQLRRTRRCPARGHSRRRGADTWLGRYARPWSGPHIAATGRRSAKLRDGPGDRFNRRE
ncbi:hypothetical protein U1Q18_052069 [Sarracenia purpurea var. burkii]